MFARAEYVRRTAEDLALVGSVSRELDIGAVSVGYARSVAVDRRVSSAVAIRGTLSLVPGELELFYGSRTPAGLLVYLELRPGVSTHGDRMAR